MHRITGPEGPSSALRRVWLLITAITLHNFPEGLAVGVGFGSGRLDEAIALMIAIRLQNMLEGLAVAPPLVREKGPDDRLHSDDVNRQPLRLDRRPVALSA